MNYEDNFILIKGKDYPLNDFSGDFKHLSLNTSLNTLKEYVINTESALAFTTSGKVKFWIDLDKLVDNKETDVYIHKNRYNELTLNNIGKVTTIETIPKLIHFIWFFGGRKFNLLNYLAIKTAKINNPDYIIYFYCDREPENNRFYDLIKHMIIVEIVTPIDYLNGHRVQYFQHKADYLRLTTLKKKGGIYLDTDIIC